MNALVYGVVSVGRAVEMISGPGPLGTPVGAWGWPSAIWETGFTVDCARAAVARARVRIVEEYMLMVLVLSIVNERLSIMPQRVWVKMYVSLLARAR